MNFGDLKTYLKSLINRKDITDSLAAQFLTMAQGRLERLPNRPSFMQRLATFTLNDATGVFTLPNDYLAMIDIYDGQVTPRRVSLSEFIRHPTCTGAPTVFVQTGHEIRLRPIPATSDTLAIAYYGSEPTMSADTDENSWGASCPDALIFGAAVFAAHHYEDERLGTFSDQYNTLVAEISQQQIEEDFSGQMSISPSYSYQDEN